MKGTGAVGSVSATGISIVHSAGAITIPVNSRTGIRAGFSIHVF